MWNQFLLEHRSLVMVIYLRITLDCFRAVMTELTS